MTTVRRFEGKFDNGCCILYVLGGSYRHIRAIIVLAGWRVKNNEISGFSCDEVISLYGDGQLKHLQILDLREKKHG